MKKTTCRDLKGACDTEITGETPEEMGGNSRKHVMEMVQNGDTDHIQAMEDMKKLSPEAQQKWYEEFRQRFTSFPDA